MADSEKLNGSVDLLAKAMRQVFKESVEAAVDPIATQVKALRTETHDLKADVAEVKQDVKRLDTDMQNGFAELRPPEPGDDATRSSRDT